MVTSMHRIKMKHLINFTPFSSRLFMTISSRSPMNPICSVLLLRPSCCSTSKLPILNEMTLLQSVTYNYCRLLSTEQQQSSTNENKTSTSLQPDRHLMRYVDELIDYREKPRRTWLTVIKVLITMFAGVNFGAYMAKLGARLLDKYEIFVRDAEEDD
ncbi:uncharacterized protein LOC107359448 [Tetranychus urticae]|nr:uncharacterized protein LOC107359448 [Tetranychus urticae]